MRNSNCQEVVEVFLQQRQQGSTKRAFLEFTGGVSDSCMVIQTQIFLEFQCVRSSLSVGTFADVVVVLVVEVLVVVVVVEVQVMVVVVVRWRCWRCWLWWWWWFRWC